MNFKIDINFTKILNNLLCINEAGRWLVCTLNFVFVFVLFIYFFPYWFNYLKILWTLKMICEFQCFHFLFVHNYCGVGREHFDTPKSRIAKHTSLRHYNTQDTNKKYQQLLVPCIFTQSESVELLTF